MGRQVPKQLRIPSVKVLVDIIPVVKESRALARRHDHQQPVGNELPAQLLQCLVRTVNVLEGVVADHHVDGLVRRHIQAGIAFYAVLCRHLSGDRVHLYAHPACALKVLQEPAAAATKIKDNVCRSDVLLELKYVGFSSELANRSLPGKVLLVVDVIHVDIRRKVNSLRSALVATPAGRLFTQGLTDATGPPRRLQNGPSLFSEFLMIPV